MGFRSSTKVSNFRRSGVYLADGVLFKDAQGVWQGAGTQNQFLLKLLGGKTIDDRGKAAIYDVEIVESSWKGNPIGSHASIYFDYSKVPEAAKRDEMLFVAACCGVDPSDEKRVIEVCTDEFLDYVSGPENPLAEFGILIPCTTKATISGKGNPFTKMFFSVARNPPAGLIG
jgi:hypothetical protein